MSDTDYTKDPPQAQDNRLRITDAKTHMVVVMWNGSVGEERYLYKDATGWYVLGWPCRCGLGADEPNKRHYLTVDADGFFQGVTT